MIAGVFIAFLLLASTFLGVLAGAGDIHSKADVKATILLASLSLTASTIAVVIAGYAS
jgi:hypothetical protein